MSQVVEQEATIEIFDVHVIGERIDNPSQQIMFRRERFLGAPQGPDIARDQDAGHDDGDQGQGAAREDGGHGGVADLAHQFGAFFEEALFLAFRRAQEHLDLLRHVGRFALVEKLGGDLRALLAARIDLLECDAALEEPFCAYSTRCWGVVRRGTQRGKVVKGILLRDQPIVEERLIAREEKSAPAASISARSCSALSSSSMTSWVCAAPFALWMKARVLRRLTSAMAPSMARTIPKPRSAFGTRVRRQGKLAEGVGFEPTKPCGIPVFKTGAFDRSATPPFCGVSCTDDVHG